MGEGPLGPQIRQWRVNLGMTMAECAREAGIVPSQWGRIESNLVGDPNMRTLIKMAAVLGAHVEMRMTHSSHDG